MECLDDWYNLLAFWYIKFLEYRTKADINDIIIWKCGPGIALGPHEIKWKPDLKIWGFPQFQMIGQAVQSFWIQI